MNAVHFLWCGLGLCLLGWQPCQGAGGGKTEKKVEMVFKEAGLERSMENDGRPGKLQWKCRAVLFVREPWGVGERSFAEDQSLGMWDAEGRELSPVEFHTGWRSENHEKGVSSTELAGVAAKLPPAGCTWFRLKGCLRIPVVRMLKSPVYELPLKQGASSLIPLPGLEEADGRNVNDVVESNDLPVGELYVKKCEWTEGDEGKTFVLGICLDANSLFQPEKFQLLDEKGKVLDDANPDSSDIDEKSRSWTADFTFSLPEKMGTDKCRVRLIYRTTTEYVSVPVDARFGIGGEIREEPEKRGGKKAG